jgi:hypothetical protein
MKRALRGGILLAAAVTPLVSAVPAAADPPAAPNGAEAAPSPYLPPGGCRSVTRRDDPPLVRGWGSVQICRSANGRRLDINGYAHDAAADGLCAQLYGQYSTGAWWYGPRACPAGNTEYFHRFKEGPVDTTVYLRFN